MLRTIQPMGSSPNAAPHTAVLLAIIDGMPKTKIATSSATTRPCMAAI